MNVVPVKGGIPDREWCSIQGGVPEMGWDTRERWGSRQRMMECQTGDDVRQGWGYNINESPKWNSSLLDL